MKKGKCKNIHSSSMSNSAWCDLNSKGNILKPYDKVPILNTIVKQLLLLHLMSICWKLDRLKANYKKIFRGTKKAWDIFLEPGLKMATPLISATVANFEYVNGSLFFKFF